jgi:hypothetical protein
MAPNFGLSLLEARFLRQVEVYSRQCLKASTRSIPVPSNNRLTENVLRLQWTAIDQDRMVRIAPDFAERLFSSASKFFLSTKHATAQ